MKLVLYHITVPKAMRNELPALQAYGGETGARSVTVPGFRHGAMLPQFSNLVAIFLHLFISRYIPLHMKTGA